MSANAIGVMLVICGAVWGGFLSLLVRAIRSEGNKGGGTPPRR